MHSGGAAICVSVLGLTVVEVLWRNAWSIVQCMHMLTCRHLKHSYVSPCRSHMQRVLESVGPWELKLTNETLG